MGAGLAANSCGVEALALTEQSYGLAVVWAGLSGSPSCGVLIPISVCVQLRKTRSTAPCWLCLQTST